MEIKSPFPHAFRKKAMAGKADLFLSFMGRMLMTPLWLSAPSNTALTFLSHCCVYGGTLGFKPESPKLPPSNANGIMFQGWAV